jgi:hypothetical protein
MKRILLTLFVLASLARPAGVSALTEPEARAGRAVIKRYADAIVSIELVATMNMSIGDHTLPPHEIRMEVNGTVLSADGLAVTALSAIDPRSEIDRMRSMAGAAARSLRFGDSQFKEVKLRLADGTEIPARVVLKDSFNDLVFVAPEPGTAAGRVFSCVDLQNTAVEEVLGTYFDIMRASRELQRIPLVNVSTIIGIAERPRRLFLVSSESVGCPVFDGSCGVLGICVRYINNGHALRFVVLPSAQVAEIAKQAEVEAAKPPAEPVPASDDSSSDDGPPPTPAAPTAPVSPP